MAAQPGWIARHGDAAARPRRSLTFRQELKLKPKGVPMTKVLVLYYSAYGHIEQMAYAAAEGAKSAGVAVDVKRAPALVPAAVAQRSGLSPDKKESTPPVDDLAPQT